MLQLNLKRNVLLVLFYVFTSFLGHTQTMNGKVVGVVSMGTQDYCFISEDGTPNVYKTSPYTAGEIAPNEPVEIRRTRVENQVEVKIENQTFALFAIREVMTPGESIYYPDMDRMPKLIGDILFFEDEAHIIEVHDMVTLFIDDESYKKDMDTKLDEIEQNEYPSFTSFRTHFDQKYNLMNGVFSESEIETMENADFINDEIHKTFFNSYRFMGVGDKIYYFHDINMTLVIDMSDTETLALLESVSRTQDNEGYDVLSSNASIFELRKAGKIKIKSPNHKTYPTHDGKGIGIVSGELQYQTIPDFGGFPCDPYKKQLAVPELYESYVDSSDPTNSYYESYWGQAPVQLTITWGDGSSDQVIDNYNGEYIIHHYPVGVQATYYPTTKMKFMNSAGTITSVFDGNNTPVGHHIEFETFIGCTNENKEQWSQSTSGNWKMTTKIWVYDNWLGHQVGSRTWSYKNQNGWGLKRAAIKTEINGTFRDSGCIAQETKTGEKFRNSVKKVQKTKSKYWANYSLANGDITSYHTLNKNGTSIALPMTLIVCD